MKVFFIDEFGNSKTVEMKQVPSKGDTVPLFFRNAVVEQVSWFPEKLFPELKDYDAVVALT